MLKRVASGCCRLILVASLPVFAQSSSAQTSAPTAPPQNYPAQSSSAESSSGQTSAAKPSPSQTSAAMQSQSSNQSGANQSGTWIQLFNGKDLSGWKHVGPGYMTVEDGLIHTHGGMGLLYWTAGKLSDCVLRVVSGCATRMTTQASSSAFPSSPAKNGCRCTTVTKYRLTIIPKNPTRTNTIPPACCIR